MSHYKTRNGIKVVIAETGESFNSIKACADFLEISPTRISRAIQDADHFSTCKGIHVVRDSEDADLYFITTLRRPVGKPVYILETGEKFESIRACARYVNGRHQQIRYAIKTGKQYRGYHYQYI